MAVVAADHRFVRCNRAFCSLVGYANGELLQRTWQSITHPDDVKGDQSGADAVKADVNHPDYTVTKRYLTKRGEVVWINLFVRGIWEDGKFECYHVTAVERNLARCEECVKSGPRPKPAEPVSIGEWIQANPKDAALAALALSALLGRDAVMDLLQLVVVGK